MSSGIRACHLCEGLPLPEGLSILALPPIEPSQQAYRLKSDRMVRVAETASEIIALGPSGWV
jgi:hypothetical protein